MSQPSFESGPSRAILLGLILLAFVVAGAIGLVQWRGAEEDEAR